MTTPSTPAALPRDAAEDGMGPPPRRVRRVDPANPWAWFAVPHVWVGISLLGVVLNTCRVAAVSETFAADVVESRVTHNSKRVAFTEVLLRPVEPAAGADRTLTHQGTGPGVGTRVMLRGDSWEDAELSGDLATRAVFMTLFAFTWNLVVGFILWGTTGRVLLRGWLVKHGSVTHGVVDAVEPSESGKHPHVVRFHFRPAHASTDLHAVHRARSTMATRLQAGQEVRVVYSPSRPSLCAVLEACEYQVEP